ncbi:MAG: hypothetical protein WC393_03130 [Candidatus Nanoarchaeia archaeon]
MELSQIISIISLIMLVVKKIAFFAICLYYGNIAFKGWKGRKNLIFQIIGTVILGIVSFFGGLILKDYIGIDFIFLEYLTSLAVAFICFILMSFISTAFEVKNNYATKMDLNAIMNDLKELKIQVAKITKALEDEKISPEELTQDDIKNKLKEELEKKGMKKYSIISLTKQVDYWTAKLSGSKEAIIDAYTGRINEITESKNHLSILYKKPLFSIGILASLFLLIFLANNINEETIASFSDAFDFSFLTTAPLPEGCMKTSALLESLNQSDIKPASLNNSLINKTIFEKTGTYIISDMIRTVTVNNISFIAAISYEDEISNIASEITNNPLENIYKTRVCVLKSNYELCECIGKEQTDIAFTVPYLIKLDLISNAIQSLIFSSLTGLIH